MAYTFGAATGDRVNVTLSLNAFNDNNVSVLCGWWYPTTLTAGRYLWSFGADNGVKVDTTTDELALITNRATTDSSKVTAGVDLAVDTWKFLAFMWNTENTGPADTWRVWAGTVDTPPVEVTVSNVATGSGNVTASGVWVLGNNNTTGTVAFQGAIDDVRVCTTSAAGSTTVHPFKVQTSGAIANEAAEFVFQRFVRPAWEGKPWAFENNLSVTSLEQASWSGRTLARIERRYTGAVQVSNLAPTVSGATVASVRCPIPTRWSSLSHERVGL